jgi:hypothetical protein
MIFNLIKDGGKYYLCMKGDNNSNLWNTLIDNVCFFSLKKLMFSNRLTTDKKHSIIEKELVELVWTLKEGEDYSYEELIKPLLRTAKLKNIGI